MRLIVNGAEHDVTVPAHETLLTTLRERLNLTGTKFVCGRGECGACTVLIEGVSVYACLTLTCASDDRPITTIEGVGQAHTSEGVGRADTSEGVGRADHLNALQTAFIEYDALQCGFCTPGQILAAM